MAMADPYDSDSAIEQILSEAMDLHTLEQISSINLSGVSPDSLLPIHLETRFRKLKSFPAPNHTPTPTPSLNSQIHEIPTTSNPSKTIPTPISSPIWDGNDFKPNPTKGHVSSPSVLSSSSSGEEEASPPQKLCFWCSPKTKRVSKKKKKRNKERGRVDDDVVALDSFISDLSRFSMKEQKGSFKKALKEQERISREAEEVVNMARQLSARMDDYVIHDDDRFK